VPSTLFDGIVGRRIEDPESVDLLQHYTWHQNIVRDPYVAMTFDPPLVELSNVTMYFYREGSLNIEEPRSIRMCFSRSLNFTPCDTIELSDKPGLYNGVFVWPVTLLTNATSVTYLRIDMEHEPGGNNDWIFLSEIRVAGRQQGKYIGVGTGPSGLVLAGPLLRTISFKKFNIATCTTLHVHHCKIATQCTNEQTIIIIT